jgi:hypothetical protein
LMREFWRGNKYAAEQFLQLNERTIHIFHQLCQKLLTIQPDHDGIILLKNPWDYGNEDEILKFFPHAKFIHITRDPLQVINSHAQTSIHHFSGKRFDPYSWLVLWGKSRASLCLERFIWRLNSTEKGTERVVNKAITRYLEMAQNQIKIIEIVPPNQLINVCYDDLVAYPQRELLRVGEFLNVSLNPSELINMKANPRPVRLLAVLEKQKYQIAAKLKELGIQCKLHEMNSSINEQTSTNEQ